MNFIRFIEIKETNRNHYSFINKQQGASSQNHLNVSNNGPTINQLNQLNGAEQINQVNQTTPPNHISLQQSHQLTINAQQQTLFNETGQNLLINNLINQQSPNYLNPNNILTPNCRADSLPNVNVNNLIAKSRSSIDLRSALSNLNEMTQCDSKKINSRNRMPSPNHQTKINYNSSINSRHQQHQRQPQQYQQYNGSYNEFNLTASNIPNGIPIQTTRSQVNLNYTSVSFLILSLILF